MAASLSRRMFQSLILKRIRFQSRFATRNLLSDSDIKLEGYLRQRIFMIDLLGSAGKATLLQQLAVVRTPRDAKQAANSITNLIHTAESQTELTELERIFKLISQEDTTKLTSFNFGASLIRLYHHLGLPDRAYAMFKDPVCRNLLRDNTCHKILMDLLYNHRHYDQVLNVYADLESFNIDCVTMALAAHYQINSTQSFIASQALVKDLLQNYALSRRALLYAGMLALNQNQPDVASETLKTCKENDLVFNLRLMCQCKLGNMKEVLENLQAARDKAEDMTRPFSVRIYEDTMETIKTAVKESSSFSETCNFDQLEKELTSLGTLSQQKLPVLLDRTIIRESDYKKEKGKHKVKRKI